MSYSRFGEADVYVFLDVSGYLNCCACSIVDEQDDWGNFKAYDTQSMVAHLMEHRNAGDKVMTDTIERLWAEHEENMKFIESSAQNKS